MAGNEVLEWANLDTEIKTAGLKDVSGCSSPVATRGLTFSDRILLLLRICMVCSCHGGNSADPDNIDWLMLTCVIIGGLVSQQGRLQLWNV